MNWREYWSEFGWCLLAMLVGVLTALAMLFPSAAEAQTTVPGVLRLRWVNPTEACVQGSTPPICGPLTGGDALTAINVYISTSPISNDSTMPPTLALPATATSANHTMQVRNGQTLYARVKAINAAGASPFSNQVSKVISVVLIPGTPSGVEIELLIGAG